MSGGHFDYKQYHIRDIWQEIEELLKNKDYFEDPVYKAMKKGLLILKIAEIYAQRIDYYLSGDDGWDNFLKRLKEDLAELGYDVEVKKIRKGKNNES